MKRAPVFSIVYVLVFLLFSFPSCTMMLSVSAAGAGEIAVFRGRVLDAEGNPVAGASLFVYNSPEVKRQADFVSSETARDGRFRMVLPPGTYWAVARLKKDKKYGPLRPGDKHSGDPETFELSTGTDFVKDFTVTDIREAARLVKKTRKDVVKIQGKIIDAVGLPVKDAYVAAWNTGGTSWFPDHLSAWTDDQGSYSLYLPPGRYSIGAAQHFPPDGENVLRRDVLVEKDSVNVNILFERQTVQKGQH